MTKVIQPKRLHKRKTVFVLSVLLIASFYAYTRDPPGPSNIKWTGHTMGTLYSVSIHQSHLNHRGLKKLQEAIFQLCKDIEFSMSTYIPNSEISRFNDIQSLEPIPVSQPFYHVTQFAKFLYERSDGTFEPTLEPIINQWGFGHLESHTLPPNAKTIYELLSKANGSYLTLLPDLQLKKEIPQLRLNLSAVAKGYAVDQIATLLHDRGIHHFYIEIGGDGRASGQNKLDQKWSIGIERPLSDSSPGEKLQAIVYLSDAQSIATSGDYRNYKVIEENKKITHLLDPRTGSPVQNNIASVTVIAASCMEADGLATTLYVMGLEEGLHWIENYENAEAYFITREKGGAFREWFSSEFKKITSFKRLDNTKLSENY